VADNERFNSRVAFAELKVQLKAVGEKVDSLEAKVEDIRNAKLSEVESQIRECAEHRAEVQESLSKSEKAIKDDISDLKLSFTKQIHELSASFTNKVIPISVRNKIVWACIAAIPGIALVIDVLGRALGWWKSGP